ncbi:MAG: hypothetical protein EBV05_11400 [Cyanobacteria bacterium WB6_1B_304]|jgi:hypothetical protein|nr:hypothetical protein [Cyanobacteria bacterium WB6_1B_304]
MTSPILVVLVVVYIGGIYKFLNGFNRTNFTSGRLPLALFWPVLLIVNKSYRQNFNKALKG